MIKDVVVMGAIAGVLMFLFLSCAGSKPQLLTSVVHDELEAEVAVKSIRSQLKDADCKLGYVELMRDAEGEARAVGVCFRYE